MPIPRLTAVQFHRFMGSGRTSPVLCGCEDHLGNPAGDLVVKLRGGLDRGTTGLLCELVASRLARHFGLAVPEPALVQIDSDFAELVASREQRSAPDKAVRIRKSAGLNFGSRQLSGVTTWPVDKAIPEAMLRSAAEIFSFDALIQNPDRRFNNPNLLTRGDDIFVFDHELGFSFLLDILPSPEPWRLDVQRYLDQHVFYRQLKAKPIDITGFTGCLQALASAAMDGILADVPPEWDDRNLPRGNLPKIEGHCERSARGRKSSPKRSEGGLREDAIQL